MTAEDLCLGDVDLAVQKGQEFYPYRKMSEPQHLLASLVLDLHFVQRQLVQQHADVDFSNIDIGAQFLSQHGFHFVAYSFLYYGQSGNYQQQ